MVNPFAAISAQIFRDAALLAPEPEVSTVRDGPRPRRFRGGSRKRYFVGRAKGAGRTRASMEDALALATGDMGGWHEPASAETTWREMDLDSATMEKLSPAQVLQLLSDISPDISRALWDFLRMCNPGWEVDVLGGADGKTVLLEGPERTAINDFLGRLKETYGSVDVVINRMYMSAFLRGAFFGEVVLDKRGKLPLDIATPDPLGVRFKRVKDRDRGEVWALGQLVDGKWEPIRSTTVKYIPIDPAPDSPYGRPIAQPAVFTSLFLLGLLHDLRRVVAQQGYPRLDLEIVMDELLKAMPEDEVEDEDAKRAWTARAIAEVEEEYNDLDPDDAFVHTSAIKVNKPVGTVDSSSLGAVGGIITNLERQIIRALKTMPLLMGVNEAASETHANRQWEVYAAGIKALQHLAESLLEFLLSKALQAQGLQAGIKFRFAELRASEELRDQQTLQLRMLNAWNAFVYGWLSQEGAAQLAFRQSADQDKPRYIPKSLVSTAAPPAEPEQGTGDGGPGQAESEDGAERPEEDERPDDDAGDERGQLPPGLRVVSPVLSFDTLSPEEVAIVLDLRARANGHTHTLP